jgi:8-oxo-dGTP pyrophosphatase MutT (NUDIX family)
VSDDRSHPRIGGQMRARAVHRVTPDDVGERVSIRYLVDDPERGPVPTDVVARLLGYRDGTLALVDRNAQLVLVAEASVLSSRVVPPHPRLPPEPDDVGTRERPLQRDAARVLLLDPQDRVLLVAHRPSARQRVWTAPGGGLRPGEDHLAAARRELREEIGIDAQVGPWIWTRHEVFPYVDVWLEQDERWYLARTDAVDPSTAPLDDPGLAAARWWTVAELRDTQEELAPAELASHLATLLRDGPPNTPIDAGR